MKLVLPRPPERYDQRFEEQRNGLIERAVGSSPAATAPAWGGITGTLADQTDLDARFDAVEADVATAQGDITTLQGDVSAAQGDITTLQSDVTALQASVPNMIVLGSDVSSTSTTSAATPISGLAISVTAGKRYHVRYVLYGSTAANTKGMKFSFLRTTADNPVTMLMLHGTGPSSAAVSSSIGVVGATGSTADLNSFNSAGTNNVPIFIEGFFLAGTADGTVTLQVGTETGGSAVTIKAGSFVEYREIP